LLTVATFLQLQDDDIVDGLKKFRFVFFGQQPPTVAELQHDCASIVVLVAHHGDHVTLGPVVGKY
jgi:hypothetical protein